MPNTLLVRYTMYPSEHSGRRLNAQDGFRPIALPSPEDDRGFVVSFRLDRPLPPGETREVMFEFMTAEGFEVMRRLDRFYVAEGSVIGEAVPLDQAGVSNPDDGQRPCCK